MSTTPNLGLTLLTAGQLQPEVTVNGDLLLLDGSLSSAAAFSNNPATTTGLTYGYFGGYVWAGATEIAVAAGTVTLSASLTNYVQMTAAGVISVNTTGFTSGQIPLATVVTGTTSITSIADKRPLTVGGGGGFTNPMTTLGDLIAGGTNGAAGRLGIGTSAQVLTVVSGVPAWAAATGGSGGSGAGGVSVLFKSTAVPTVALSATSASLIPSGVGSLVVGANTLAVGSSILAKIVGYVSVAPASSSSIFPTVTLGAATAGTSTAGKGIIGTTAAGFPFYVEALISCLSIGTTGSIAVSFRGGAGHNTNLVTVEATEWSDSSVGATLTLNTTIANTLNVLLAASVACSVLIANATVLSLANVASGPVLPVDAQTGTAYTLALSDAPAANGYQGLVTMNNAAANTLTVPPNSAVAFPVGAQLQVTQLGAGQTAVAAGAGVTVSTPSTLTARAAYSTLTLTQVAANVWVLGGDMT